MRIVTWNIRAGGGKRIERIAQVLLQESADLLVLTEYRSRPCQPLHAVLESEGYRSLAGTLEGAHNCVYVAGRDDLIPAAAPRLPISQHRWISAHLPTLDLHVVGAHVPNMSEKWNKRDFLESLEAFAEHHVEGRGMIIGDLNTALDEDCQGSPIREAIFLKRMFARGWVDAWRCCNADRQDYSWFSQLRNGFRLDHCLVTPSLGDRVRTAHYRHDVLTEGLSDHAMLIVELDL